MTWGTWPSPQPWHTHNLHRVRTTTPTRQNITQPTRRSKGAQEMTEFDQNRSNPVLTSSLALTDLRDNGQILDRPPRHSLRHAAGRCAAISAPRTPQLGHRTHTERYRTSPCWARSNQPWPAKGPAGCERTRAPGSGPRIARYRRPARRPRREARIAAGSGGYSPPAAAEGQGD